MSEIEAKTDQVKIVCRHHGPLRVSGNFVLEDPDGNRFEFSGREYVSLCRCGQSNKKPFCDGAHKECGFEHEVHAFKL